MVFFVEKEKKREIVKADIFWMIFLVFSSIVLLQVIVEVSGAVGD